MASEHISDEETLRTLPDGVLALLSADQRGAMDRILARLAAAEKVCELIKVSLSPKLRETREKKIHWWDVGMAVKEWETLARPGPS
jgi:hypothetical protein